MISRHNAERSINQLLSLILGGQKARASGHLAHNLSERLEFCFKLVQQEMEQTVRTADPEALQKALSDGQRQLSSLQSLTILNQLIQEVEW
ncbi:MAG: hypothetical protein EBY40_07970 [Marivivens sp.]|nr:hypothetical protein [Marivivens sp.]NBT52601.1 hypothetical protein [Marivivens sp.]NCW69478.1 hypothetical protein [Marivivens sp.]NDH03049.1 hypothetical protein [Marivivens sp.]